jgi:hypothetical protein
LVSIHIYWKNNAISITLKSIIKFLTNKIHLIKPHISFQRSIIHYLDFLINKINTTVPRKEKLNNLSLKIRSKIVDFLFLDFYILKKTFFIVYSVSSKI